MQKDEPRREKSRATTALESALKALRIAMAKPGKVRGPSLAPMEEAR